MSESSPQMAENLSLGNWETVSAKKMATMYVASILTVFNAPIQVQR